MRKETGKKPGGGSSNTGDVAGGAVFPARPGLISSLATCFWVAYVFSYQARKRLSEGTLLLPFRFSNSDQLCDFELGNSYVPIFLPEKW